jgi:hypothetical protein
MVISDVPADIELKPAGSEKSESTQTPQNSNSNAGGGNPPAETNKTSTEVKPGGEKTGQASTGTPANEPQDIADDVFIAHLSKKTGGKLNNLTDFEAIVSERDAFKKQVDEGIQPKFSSERAKLAHKLLSESQGNEIQSAMRTLRALSYETKGKEGKDIMFEAYLLDPKNSDLSPENAREYFEADFERKFGNAETDVLQKRELELSVRSATEAITKLQTEFQTTEEKPMQVAKEVEEAVSKAVKGLKSLKFSFSENAPETEVLNVAIDNPQELQALEEAVLMPDKAYNELASQFGDVNSFNYGAFTQELWERNNHKKLRQLAYDHGFKLGKLAQLNENRNASNPKDVSKIGNPGGGNGEPKSLAEAWAKAQGVQ